jgi:peptide-methionine (S)-S-oxide reductase
LGKRRAGPFDKSTRERQDAEWPRQARARRIQHITRRPRQGVLIMEQAQHALEIATLAGGCFWCLEAVFLELRGVESVISGYAGGLTEAPTYEQVCSGRTGHAEVVQIKFDPKTISYEDLLHVFFTIHDPTTRNRQGADVGTQYRSAIFYHSDQQKAAVEKVIAELDAASIWDGPIVTEVTAYTKYFPAEAYHQNYYNQNASQPYCKVVIAPKVAKAREKFFEKLKKK